jgi:hypothetical protein
MKISSKKSLVVLLIFSVLFRLLASLYLGDQVEIVPGAFDQISYHSLALRVQNGHGFSFDRHWWPFTSAGEPTAHWSFLYTFYLVFVYSIFGPHPIAARMIQSVIVGILHPWLVYLITKRVFSQNPIGMRNRTKVLSKPHADVGEIIGLTAAGLTAFYIYFIYYSATLMTEPFYITAILGLLYLMIIIPDVEQDNVLSTKIAIGLGVTLGAAILLRQLFLLFVPFIILWIFIAFIRSSRLIPITKYVFICISILVICILPFTLYNYTRFDSFVLLNTNAGYAFFWGNHPIYGTKFEGILPPEWGVTYQELIPEAVRHLDEAALGQELLNRGLGFVFDDPLRYIQLSLSRIPVYFNFWPSPNSSLISNISRIFSFGLMLPFMLLGLFLTMKRKMNVDQWLLIIFILLYTGVHLATWALIRYRLPVDAILLVFAGRAIVDLLARFPKLSAYLFPDS